MQLLAATVVLFPMLALAVAQASPERAATGAGTPSAASREDSQALRITRSGSQPVAKGPSEQFTGTVRVERLFQPGAPSRASGAYVTFEPGARTAWHAHPLGQTLVVTAGSGRVQRWGSAIEEIRPGDVVWIPPGQKHWHGASPNTAMTHLAIQEQLDGKVVEWMEKVSDAQYSNQPREERTMSTTKPATTAQKAIGDFAPKLVELTDDVLFGDIWERPQLSKRDRSLITCAALVATGKTEQMNFHFPRAIENGVTQEELTELITHLAFYVGWPNAMSAITRAKELFEKKSP
ncbi:(R)-mandelonitrile lyase [Archangium lansingense]|uniref:Carboxymuconolactone decarboxylase family protein n=1 Tax=Archangium lansingense TaxID=2995310 RepID=A0ABT4ADU0_9BACT|nr:carboxymuconolactone decarboxylase family protein [Archangium lansinium]MCY1079831.1 carboxymuconolactone decarboxylase family protein [Archangium lansinium]